MFEVILNEEHNFFLFLSKFKVIIYILNDAKTLFIIKISYYLIKFTVK